MLVAGGLTPLLAPQTSPVDQDDILFLNALYKTRRGANHAGDQLYCRM